MIVVSAARIIIKKKKNGDETRLISHLHYTNRVV